MVVGRCWLDRHGAQGVEGRLEGLARAEPNEGTHLEAAREPRLQVRRLVDRRLRGSEARPLVAVQKHPRAARGRGRCLARWWRLPVECCGRGEDPATEFRIRYCHGWAPSLWTSRERRADPGLG